VIRRVRYNGTFLTIGLTFAAVLAAQQQPASSAPRLAYIYPAGGQQGTTVQVTVAGLFLDPEADVLVSGRHVKGSVTNLDRPLNQRQITELRDRIQQMAPTAANDPAVRQQLMPLRAQLNDSVRRSRTPNFSELATLQIKIDPDAEPGARQVRLQTPMGLSNPVLFVVGQLPEVKEREVKNSRADAELAVTLPVTANGRLIPGDIDAQRQPLRTATQYAPGDVDRYRFPARKGQDLVITVEARSLMPYLADAVPGWFQAVVTLFDADGHEIGFCDDYRFDPDPVLHVSIPADGEYVAEIRDSIYRGREDFVYRISIGELPFVTSVFPLGALAGSRAAFSLTGWNLPSGTLTVPAAGQPGVYTTSVRAGTLQSNRVMYSVDSLPERFEREPNNAGADAQALTLPAIVNGRIDQPGDRDMFSFRGRAGESIVADVIARRLGSPVDAVLELMDSRGQRIGFNDDRDDKADGLSTHHADPYLLTKLPGDGTYFIRLSDRLGAGGREYGYRLRVSAPQPDFELRVSPSSIDVAGGSHAPVLVTAIRKDGFDGDIALALHEAPAGFAISGGVIPAGQDAVRITVTPPAVTTRDPISVRIDGRATIDGKTIAHDALATDDRMQAFAYHHLVPADDLRLMVAARGGTRVPSRIIDPLPIEIPAGGFYRVRVSLPPAFGTLQNIQFELDDPPAGISIRDAQVVGAMGWFTIAADATKVDASHARGNLIVLVTGERVQAATAQTAATRRRVPLGALPAVQYEIKYPKTLERGRTFE
jgi:hypothetical protein